MLDLLLGGHSKCASLGEFSFLGKAVALDQSCSCGAPITRCEAWTGVFRRVREELGVDLLADPYALPQWDTRASVIVDRRQQTALYLAMARLRTAICDLVYSAQAHGLNPGIAIPKYLRRGVANTLALYAIIGREWGKDVLVDSSKNIHKALSLYRAAPDRVRVIFLTRDGRGVYYSRRSSGFSSKESISGWLNYNHRAQSLLPNIVDPEHLCHVKYEQLVGNLDGKLQEICRFLDLDYEPGMASPPSVERHMCNGNKAMFDKELVVRPDLRWKEGLTGDDYAAFQRNCGALNRKLGYDD